MSFVSTSPSVKYLPFIQNNLCQRIFSSSYHRDDHYRTLGVPPQATKAQIKSHFYQLSKTHHPDIAKDARSKDIFNAVSEAYAVLSNDRERRAYDRMLHQQRPASSTPYPRAPLRKGPRASYAWEYSSRSRGSSQRRNPSAEWQQHTHPGPQQHKHPGQHYIRPEPPSYHQVSQKSRQQPLRKAEEEESEMDRVRRESGLMRAMQVLGLIAVSVTVFGGWGPVGR